jgi:hypothetical protein
MEKLKFIVDNYQAIVAIFTGGCAGIVLILKTLLKFLPKPKTHRGKKARKLINKIALNKAEKE